MAGDFPDVQSAGSKPAGYVNPLGIQMMKEIGIDITAQRSKHMNDFLQQNMETVITVCVFTAYAEGRRDQLKATE